MWMITLNPTALRRYIIAFPCNPGRSTRKKYAWKKNYNVRNVEEESPIEQCRPRILSHQTNALKTNSKCSTDKTSLDKLDKQWHRWRIYILSGFRYSYLHAYDIKSSVYLICLYSRAAASRWRACTGIKTPYECMRELTHFCFLSSWHFWYASLLSALILDRPSCGLHPRTFICWLALRSQFNSILPLRPNRIYERRELNSKLNFVWFATEYKIQKCRACQSCRRPAADVRADNLEND